MDCERENPSDEEDLTTWLTRMLLTAVLLAGGVGMLLWFLIGAQ